MRRWREWSRKFAKAYSRWRGRTTGRQTFGAVDFEQVRAGGAAARRINKTGRDGSPKVGSGQSQRLNINLKPSIVFCQHKPFLNSLLSSFSSSFSAPTKPAASEPPGQTRLINSILSLAPSRSLNALAIPLPSLRLPLRSSSLSSKNSLEPGVEGGGPL